MTTVRVRAALVLCAIPMLIGCGSTPTPSRVGPTSSPAASDPPAPSTAADAVFRWDAPADGTKVTKKKVTLRAVADAAGASDDATVVFSVDWPGSPPRQACEASAQAGGAAWECEVDLAALKAPSGSLRVDFDVSNEGGVDASPDGTRTLQYRPPAPKWRTARTILPRRCDAPVLAIDPNGYHVAATCGGSIGTAEGSATGAWTKAMFAAPAHRTESDPQLVADGDTLHLAYTRYGPLNDAETCGSGVSFKDLGVYERTRSLPDGAWSDARQIGRSGDVLDAFRAMDGTLHAIVLPQGSSTAVYEQVAGGSTTRVPLPRSSGGTSLRVGDDGKARVAYVDWRDGNIQLATVDGTSVSTEVVASKGNLLNPLLVLGAGNQPYLVWTRDATAAAGCAVPDPLPADGTYYGTKVDGRWVVERITKATGPTSMVLDTDTGAVHVLVNGSPNMQGGGRLEHAERTPSGKWTSEGLLDSPAEGSAIIRQDASDGTLVVVYDSKDGVQMLTRR